MTEFDVLLWLKLDKISYFFGFISILFSMIIVIVGAFAVAVWVGNEDRKVKRMAIIGMCVSLLLFCISSALSLIIPTTKQYAIMKVMPNIANSETLKKDSAEIYTMAVEALKDILKGEGNE